MANFKTFQRSFAGGEVTPELFGRIDDAKYQSGLALCRNFITKPQGPAENRPGFRFVRAVKNPSVATRLIPFTYSTTQTMVIELGAGYFRFHTNGSTLLNPDGSVLEVANPYADYELFDIHYVQSADVLTLVHTNHPPSELRRHGPLDWRLTEISFAATISPPGQPTLSKNGTEEAQYTYSYVVTAVSEDGISESRQSVAAEIQSDLFASGSTITISWPAASGASRYNIYKMQGGVYGYIGQSNSTSIIDDNIAPDLGKTPPIYDSSFVSGRIVSIPVVNGGIGYGSAETGGGITSVAVDTVGSNYEDGDTITVDDLSGSGCTLKLNVYRFDPHFVTSVDVLTPGTLYRNPIFTAHSTTGSGATFNANIAPITNVEPVLVLEDPTGTGAKISPVFAGGVLQRVDIVDPGQNYSNPIVYFINAAGGSGAVFGPIEVSSDGGGGEFGDDFFPGAVSYFEQRRCFAGTLSKPQNIWMTKSGTESNMSYSLPIKDDDRISFRVAAREANTIRHIVPLTQLLLLTSSAEWRVSSINSDAITPTTISVRPQSYVGASNVQPVIVNNTLIYGAARGGHARELAYNWQASGFITGDLSLRAPHLFDGYNIADMAYAQAPQPIVWFVSTSGKLLGLTYVPEQQVGAWHQHETEGAFESCTVVTEGDEDVLYCIIRRNIGSDVLRYVERMETRRIINLTDAFFVDCGATYEGEPATSISGLSHLEGKTVNILADGAVHNQRVVTGGQVQLEVAASKVHIGLPIVADLETLPVAAQLDNAFGQGRTKNINRAWIRVFNSSGIWLGPSENQLKEVKQRTTEPYGTPPSLQSREFDIMTTPNWGATGQVFVRQKDPLPLTIVSLTAEVSTGG